jgi:MFS family permease
MTASGTAWAPLRVHAFRALWVAQLFSMIGTWMQTVGAQWLLVARPDAATLVSLVQTLAMLPVLLLALPAGALADIVDRRRMLIVVQGFQVVVGAVLTGLSLAGGPSPTALLTLTFLLGCGTTVTLPGYQSLVQELVPREQLRSAAALNGVAMNIARAVGPAIAGLLVAQVGVAAVFALNAATYLVLGGVLARLRLPDAGDGNRLPERLGGALAAGWRYVRNAPIVRRIMLRTLLFAVPASALWALLPLVASRLLHLDAGGYGLLLAALGIGAVTGAMLLPRFNRMPANRLVLTGGLLFAVGTLVSVVARYTPLVVIALVPAGLAWLAVLATLGGTLQAFLPGWVRARGLSIQQMALAGGQALGSLAWGLIAQWIGVTPALLASAALLVACTASVVLWPLHDESGLDRTPVTWPDPHLEFDPDLEDGPILVTRTFTVAPERVAEFLAAMDPVRRSRMRTGATRCVLYRDGEDPRRIIEYSLYPTWAEHLRQHTGRLMGSDIGADERAIALADGPPSVRHMFPARSLLTQSSA